MDQLRAGRAQAQLRQMYSTAMETRWMKMLVFGFRQRVYIRDGMTGLTRLADSDDEDEEGVWDAHLDYVNPLWKMQLAGGPRPPMEILIKFLGMAPLY